MVEQYDVIIPASGSSTRFGTNKLEIKIGPKTVLEMAIEPFLNDKKCQNIILVVPDEKCFLPLNQIAKIRFVIGGSTRFLSVKNGVEQSQSDTILIHDGARPFLSNEVLETILKSDFQFGSLVTPVRDSIIRIENNHPKYLERSGLFLVQTPQFFQREYLVAAYSSASGLENDELSFVQNHFPEVKPCFITGDLTNFKITYPEDIKK